MWFCYQFLPNETIKEKKLKIKNLENSLYDVEKNGIWDLLGGIDLPKDCFGDDLYDHMIEMGWIQNMDFYDVFGNSEIVYVTGKTKKYPNYKWVFNTKI